MQDMKFIKRSRDLIIEKGSQIIIIIAHITAGQEIDALHKLFLTHYGHYQEPNITNSCRYNYGRLFHGNRFKLRI